MNSASTPVPYPWKRESTACVYCCSELPLAASYCRACSKFQNGWKNWIPHLGAVIAALTLSGTVASFAWSSYQSLQQEHETRQRQLELESTKVVGESVIGSFAALTSTIERFVTNYDKQVQATVAYTEEALKNPGSIIWHEDDCTPLSARCRVALVSAEEGPVPLSLGEERAIHVLIVGEMRSYAQALKLIALADSPAQIAAGADAATASITNIARYLVAASAPSLSASGAANWGNEDGIGAMRLKALQLVTRAADPILQDGAQKTGAVIDITQGVIKTHLTTQFGEARLAFDREPTRSNLDHLLGAARDLDFHLRNSPRKLVEDLVAAHSILAARLQENTTFDDVLARFTLLRQELENAAMIPGNSSQEGMKLRGSH